MYPSGSLGMGVTIDKSRGNTIVEGVSIKSVIEGGSAALARSPRKVGLKLGKGTDQHSMCMDEGKGPFKRFQHLLQHAFNTYQMSLLKV